jgi:hypothetical protein
VRSSYVDREDVTSSRRWAGIKMIFSLIGAIFPATQIWHLVPLMIAVSLVYGATRFEQWRDILEHSLRFAVWVLGFLGLFSGLLLWLSWKL